jgi:hypothetical protein
MAAHFLLNQRKTRGHRPRLQKTQASKIFLESVLRRTIRLTAGAMQGVFERGWTLDRLLIDHHIIIAMDDCILI